MTRDIRLLAGAAGISALGDFMAIFPLALHIGNSTGSAFAVSGLFLALWAPVVLASGAAGAIVDRFENRALLAGVSFAQAALMLACAAAVDELWALLPLTALIGLGVAVGQPAEFALVPAAADSEDRVSRANGLMETARGIGFTVGPLVGGALAAGGLLSLAIALNAATFVVVGAAALALRVRRRPAHGVHADGDHAPRARDGFAFLLGQRDLAIILGGAIAALGLFTMSATAEPFFVTDVLGLGSFGYGVLVATWTIGMAAGAAGIAHRIPSKHLAAAALLGVVAQGIGLAGAGASSVLLTACLGFGFGGVAHGVKNVLLRTLIHERAPEAMRGRVFAAYNGARNAAELGALAIGGLVVGAFGARVALLTSGIGPALIGLLCLLVLTTPTIQRRTADAHVQG